MTYTIFQLTDGSFDLIGSAPFRDDLLIGSYAKYVDAAKELIEQRRIELHHRLSRKS